jgi:hypothetical protein
MADTYHRVSPRIIDENLMQDMQYQQPLQPTPSAPVPPQNTTQQSAAGGWLSDMSMNKKIAVCIIVAVIIIFILVLIVRYYNSQPIAQQPLQTPLQQTQPPPMPPQNTQRAPQQPTQQQYQQMQSQQQYQQQSPQQPSQQQSAQQSSQQSSQQPAKQFQQQAAQQSDLMSKNEALEALQAVSAAENVVGRSVNDISQFMATENSNTTQLSDYCDISNSNNDDSTQENTIDESERCNATTSAGKPCRNRIKANGKCHLHLE